MDIEPLNDVSPAEWIGTEIIRGSRGRVANYIPRRFRSIERVLHRAGQGAKTRWQDLAPSDSLAPDVQFSALSNPAEVYEPPVGRLDPSSRDALVAVLQRLFGGRGRSVYIGSWVGHQAVAQQGPTYRSPRECVLVATTYSSLPDAIDQLNGFAYHWFDDTNEWLVASEIDFDSSLVGGPRELSQALENDPIIESVPVQPTTWLSIDEES